MHLLDPIYKNTIGTTILIRDDIKTLSRTEKIQLQIDGIALILEEKELVALLNTINKAKDGCACKNCKEKNIPKSIKFNTLSTILMFKSNTSNLCALENLIKRTLFELEISCILGCNNISL